MFPIQKVQIGRFFEGKQVICASVYVWYVEKSKYRVNVG